MDILNLKYHRVQLTLLFLTLIAVPVFAFVLQQQQQTRQEAAGQAYLPQSNKCSSTLAPGYIDLSIPNPSENLHLTKDHPGGPQPGCVASNIYDCTGAHVNPLHPDGPTNYTGISYYRRPGAHPDYSLDTRGYSSDTGLDRYLIDYGQTPDSKAPKLSTLLEKQTYITATYTVNGWDWTDATKTSTNQKPYSGTYPVTAIGLYVEPGDVIRLPYTENQDVEGGTGYKAFLINYKQLSNGPGGNVRSEMTLKYTREDNVVTGYTIHLLGDFQIEQGLRDKYLGYNNITDNSWRFKLPAIKGCQQIAVATGNDITVAIRDRGNFLDPRSSRDWWDVENPTAPVPAATHTPTPTVTPPIQPSSSPTPTDIPSNAIIQYQIKNSNGNLIDPGSGSIYMKIMDSITGDQLIGNSYNKQPLGSPNQQCFSKQANGIYNCNVPVGAAQLPHVRFYAGIGDLPTGYTVLNGGLREETFLDSDTSNHSLNLVPFSLTQGNTRIVEIKLHADSDGPVPTNGPTDTPPQSTLPDCRSINGPTFIRLGTSGTFSAQYSSPNTNVAGTINAVKGNNSTPTDPNTWDWKPWPPTTLPSKTGTLTFEWTPTSPGTYQVFCRSWDTASNPQKECRGTSITVDQPPVYLCEGAGTVMTVTVSSATIPTAQPGQPDICLTTQLMGGKRLSPDIPISIAAIAKPEYSIQRYTFAFYNMDNNEKPIQFAAGKDYIIDSAQNTIPLKYSDFDHADLNDGYRIPKNIKIQAYFTDRSSGTISPASANCTQLITVEKPTQTPPATNTPTLVPSSDTVNWSAVAALAGVIIVVTVVAINFFFSA